jgi:hypothetical protein
MSGDGDTPGAATSTAEPVPPGSEPAGATRVGGAVGSLSDVDQTLLEGVTSRLLTATGSAAGVLDPAVTTQAASEVLLAARDALRPTASVADFLATLLGVPAAALRSATPTEMTAIVNKALRGAAPAIPSWAVVGGAQTPSTTGSSAAPAPPSPAGISATAVFEGLTAPSTLGDALRGQSTTLPTDLEASWIDSLASSNSKRLAPLRRMYYTEWGQKALWGETGSDGTTPSADEIQVRLDTAARLELLASVEDLGVSPMSAAGFTRIPTDLELGKKAHQVLQQQYLDTHLGNLICVDGVVHNYGAISSLSDVPESSPALSDQELVLFRDALREQTFNPNTGKSRDSSLRVDIADFVTHTMGEIKPLGSCEEAVVQLWAYMTYANCGFQYITAHWLFAESSWPSVPLMLPLEVNLFAFAFQFPGLPGSSFVALPGLILYELYTFNGDEDLDAALTLAVAGGLASLALRAGLQPEPAIAASGPRAAANDDREPAEQPAAAGSQPAANDDTEVGTAPAAARVADLQALLEFAVIVAVLVIVAVALVEVLATEVTLAIGAALTSAMNNLGSADDAAVSYIVQFQSALGSVLNTVGRTLVAP